MLCRKWARRFSTSREVQQLGLFGVKNLINSKDFDGLTDRAINRCDQLRGRIARFSREAMTHEQAYELLILLDRVSNEVCSVIDAAQLCMNVHTNESFISAADASYGKLASYIHVLNSDTALYKSLIAITSNATLLSSLSSECQIFALDLKREFESEGIHLLGDKRNNLANIQNEIVKAETSFMQNAAKGDSTNFNLFMLGPFPEHARGSDADEYTDLKAWLSNHIPQPKQNDSDPTGKYLLTSCGRKIVHPLLRSIHNESIREKLWRAYMQEPVSNQTVLGNLIKYRQELAGTLGYRSYAHKYLANKVIKSPEKVSELLAKTAGTIAARAQQEVGLLLDTKKRVDGGKGSEVRLRPWDVSYMTSCYQSMYALTH